MRSPTSSKLALDFTLVAFRESLVDLEDGQEGLEDERGRESLCGRACYGRREGRQQQRPAAGSVLAWRETWKGVLRSGENRGGGEGGGGGGGRGDRRVVKEATGINGEGQTMPKHEVKPPNKMRQAVLFCFVLFVSSVVVLFRLLFTHYLFIYLLTSSFTYLLYLVISFFLLTSAAAEARSRPSVWERKESAVLELTSPTSSRGSVACPAAAAAGASTFPISDLEIEGHHPSHTRFSTQVLLQLLHAK